ncbi:MAG: hypothetical protein RIS52_298 [Pseudomonadota bacterium]
MTLNRHFKTSLDWQGGADLTRGALAPPQNLRKMANRFFKAPLSLMGRPTAALATRTPNQSYFATEQA